MLHAELEMVFPATECSWLTASVTDSAEGCLRCASRPGHILPTRDIPNSTPRTPTQVC